MTTTRTKWLCKSPSTELKSSSGRLSTSTQRATSVPRFWTKLSKSKQRHQPMRQRARLLHRLRPSSTAWSCLTELLTWFRRFVSNRSTKVSLTRPSESRPPWSRLKREFSTPSGSQNRESPSTLNSSSTTKTFCSKRSEVCLLVVSEQWHGRSCKRLKKSWARRTILRISQSCQSTWRK